MSKPAGERYRISVDFDGVLSEATAPWVAHHVIPDPPVKGALEWLVETTKRFDVVIHTTRARTWRGRRAVRRWLTIRVIDLWLDPYDTRAFWRMVEQMTITDRKLPCLVYLDDRAMRFEGKFPTANEIHAARPWNKPKVSA